MFLVYEVTGYEYMYKAKQKIIFGSGNPAVSKNKVFLGQNKNVFFVYHFFFCFMNTYCMQKNVGTPYVPKILVLLSK